MVPLVWSVVCNLSRLRFPFYVLTCLLSGWSLGGVIAFEVSRQLIASGITVPGIVLIDSPHPRTDVPLSDDVINKAFAQNLPSRASELVRKQMHFATRALVEYNPDRSPAKHVTPPKAVMLRSKESFHPATGNSKSDAFLADRRDPLTVTAEWKAILGRDIPVLDIPGNHFQPFEPHNVSPAAFASY